MSSWSDRSTDRHPWSNPQRPSTSRRETHIPLSCDPLEESREDAEHRLIVEAANAAHEFVKAVYGAGEVDE